MSEEAKIDYAEVMRRLPHRYPFLLVDKAKNFVAATSITGIKNVSHNEPFFPGHFPIDPVMPGVLIVEAMAQTGALLMSKSLDVAVADKVIMFMSIDGVRFRKPARPGDQLRMEVKVIKARGDAYKFRGETFTEAPHGKPCEKIVILGIGLCLDSSYYIRDELADGKLHIRKIVGIRIF